MISQKIFGKNFKKWITEMIREITDRSYRNRNQDKSSDSKYKISIIKKLNKSKNASLTMNKDAFF